jgi:flagellar basal-body rod protein FlgB
MDPTRTAPLALAERRLAWLDARQRVLAENIAHADTPGYRPKDLTDFAALLRGRGAVDLARTQPAHFASPGGTPKSLKDRFATETSPNGNGVSLDREAMKIAETDTAHALATRLHKSWLGMFGSVLGMGN